MNEAQRKALKRIAPVLQGELQCLANSYTNLIGPAIGRITESDILKEARSIEAFMRAFDLEFTPLSELCAEQIRDFARQLNRV